MVGVGYFNKFKDEAKQVAQTATDQGMKSVADLEAQSKTFMAEQKAKFLKEIETGRKSGNFTKEFWDAKERIGLEIIDKGQEVSLFVLKGSQELLSITKSHLAGK